MVEVRDYLVRRLREIGAVEIDADSERITISAKQLQNVKIADLAERPSPQDEDVSAQGHLAFVKRERLINLEDYEHDTLEIKRPVSNTSEAICAEIVNMDGLLDKWELKAKASCTKRRIQAREEDRRIEQEAELAEEEKMVEARAKVLALVSQHPDWTSVQVCTELGDQEHRGRYALQQLMQDGAVIRDYEKGVWQLPEEEKEEQGEQSDPSVF